MQTIHAIYENGLFRPTGPVNLPEGTAVRLISDPHPESETPEMQARQRVYEILSRSYDDGSEPGNILETHNDHQ